MALACRAAAGARRVAALSTSAGAADTPRVQHNFPVTTKSDLTHYRIVEEIGVVAGGDVRTKNLIKDILAALAGMFGGETTFYSHLLNESSAASVDKVVDHAKQLKADGVVGLRFNTAGTMNRLVAGLHSLVLAYGTAVRLEPLDPAVDPYGIASGRHYTGAPAQPVTDAPRRSANEQYEQLIRRSGSEPR